MINAFIYLAKMSNLTWKLNSLFWVILSQNLCKFCYSFWPILCPAKAAFDNNKTTAKNSWKFVITWPVSLLSLARTLCTALPKQNKVHIFWEGHKILRNLHHRFVLCSIGQIFGGDFAKFCGLLRIYEI